MQIDLKFLSAHLMISFVFKCGSTVENPSYNIHGLIVRHIYPNIISIRTILNT